jgi:hypothetical protein
MFKVSAAIKLRQKIFKYKHIDEKHRRTLNYTITSRTMLMEDDVVNRAKVMLTEYMS